jgi:hypothetical protein
VLFPQPQDYAKEIHLISKLGLLRSYFPHFPDD